MRAQRRQDQGAQIALRQARHRLGADHRRRLGAGGLRQGGAQSARGGRAAGAGHQRLRHSPAREARADQGRRRGAGGAIQMSAHAAYDVILSPVITEKATAVSESNQVVFKVRRDATKPEIKAAVEALFKVKVLSVNTLTRKGKSKNFRGVRGRQQDVKKAIVRLAEGQTIDVTTRI